MKKKVFIIVISILILLLAVIGIAYFTYPKDKIIPLAKEDVIDSNENTIDVSTDNITSNEIATEISTIIPEVEKETKIDDEIPKKDETIVDKTVTTVSTSNSSTKNTTSTNKNTQKGSKVNKEEGSKTTTTPTNIEKAKTNETITSKPVDKPNETNKVTQPTRCTSNNNHGMDVGNCEKWFNSKNGAISYYEEKIKYWNEWWKNADPNDTNADATYYKNCPTGYEYWSCMYCNKWTINLYYR